MAVKENVKIAEAQKQYEELMKDEGIQYQIFMREKTEVDIKLARDAYHKKETKKIAKKLLEEGLSIEKISNITNLSKEEIEKLKKN